jgi:hypothetical protein
MPIPIGLSGLAGHGKDTAFNYLREWAEERCVLARRRSFADALKLSFARMFLPDCSIDEAVIWCNEIKFTGELFITWNNANENGTKTSIEHAVSGRTALQRYGTEGHRGVFGDNFWVDVLFPLEQIWHEQPDGSEVTNYEMRYPHNFMGPLDQEPPDFCVAADTRFENEATRVRELEGYNLLIIRPSLEKEMLKDSEWQHASEAGLPGHLIDWSIRADDLEDLRTGVRQFADVMLAPRLGVEPSQSWPTPVPPEEK